MIPVSDMTVPQQVKYWKWWSKVQNGFTKTTTNCC